ncbi:hypothetical protein ES703_84307 [subsurface metagenome]
MLAHECAMYPCGKGHLYCRVCYGAVCPECLLIKERQTKKLKELEKKKVPAGVR